MKDKQSKVYSELCITAGLGILTVGFKISERSPIARNILFRDLKLTILKIANRQAINFYKTKKKMDE